MDNLVLVRVAAALDADLRGTMLHHVRADVGERWRLVFEAGERAATVLLSLQPATPWIGRPVERAPAASSRRAPSPFLAACARALARTPLLSVSKAGPDAVLTLQFADGQALAAELSTHRANLVHLDARGALVAVARRPPSAGERLVPGQLYRPPNLPQGKLVPFGADAAAIDRVLAQSAHEGDDLVEALRRRLFGIGAAAAALIAEECRASGRSPGTVLESRLGRLHRGEDDPVIEAEEEPLVLAETGFLDPARVQLLPWPPASPRPGMQLFRRSDAAATAGLFYEARDRAARLASRAAGLEAILRRETRRTWEAQRKAAADAASFEDPDKYRRWGESLLAGLAHARRTGDMAVVPDPYDPEARETTVPAPAGKPLTQVAEGHFRKHRRARRGIEATRLRSLALEARRERLERMSAQFEGVRAAEDTAKLEEAMRAIGIPVGLEPRPPRTRDRSGATGLASPRLEGVRMLTSTDGLTILVGRTGRDNARLTFKLAGPDDFWFHVQGMPGAHVVVRNPDRRPHPPAATLMEAAAAAAWFSDARGQGQVDVHWTRRKNVRPVRGAQPGTVTLKRSAVVRVRPAAPPDIAS